MSDLLPQVDVLATLDIVGELPAGWFVQFTEWLVDQPYWERFLVRVMIFVGVVVLAWILNVFTKSLVLRAIKAIAKKTHNEWDNCLIKNKFFTRLSHIAPAIAFYACAPLVFAGYPAGLEKMRLAVYLYLVFIGLFVVDA